MAFFIKKTQRHGGTEKNNTFSEDTEKKLCVSVTLCLLRITIPRVLRRGGRAPCQHLRQLP